MIPHSGSFLMNKRINFVFYATARGENAMIELKGRRDGYYQQVIRDLLPEIPNAVRLACMSHWHRVDTGETEDLCQQVVLLLIRSDYRFLRSFDDRRASLKTWLKVVVRNYVRRYRQSRKRLQHTEEIVAEALYYRPALETDILSKQRMKSLDQAIGKLTEREKQLYEFLCRDDLDSLEIARLMGVKVGTLRKRKHDLIEKLRKLVERGEGREEKV